MEAATQNIQTGEGERENRTWHRTLNVKIHTRKARFKKT